MLLKEVVEEPLSGLVSLLLLLINTLIQCRPSNFDSTFHYEGQPNDETRDNFCEPSPLISSYWGTLFSTVAVYTLGLQSWPLYNFTWWLSYYSWFSSVYYFQLFVYPWLYSFILPFRGKKEHTPRPDSGSGPSELRRRRRLRHRLLCARRQQAHIQCHRTRPYYALPYRTLPHCTLPYFIRPYQTLPYPADRTLRWYPADRAQSPPALLTPQRGMPTSSRCSTTCFRRSGYPNCIGHNYTGP